MYRVKITNEEGDSTERVGECLWTTVLRTAECHIPYTMRAFFIGFIARCIVDTCYTERAEQLFYNDEPERLTQWLQSVRATPQIAESIPVACQRVVDHAISLFGNGV